jgi:hypothetical protein
MQYVTKETMRVLRDLTYDIMNDGTLQSEASMKDDRGRSLLFLKMTLFLSHNVTYKLLTQVSHVRSKLNRLAGSVE